MTQSTTKPFADFSDYQGDPLLSDDPVIKQKALDQASEDAAIAKALQDAKEAMKSKQEAPAVKAVKAKLVKPKATKKATTKAGRIVGVSKDENEFIQQLLQSMKTGALSPYSKELVKNPSFAKIEARYNK